MLQILPDLTLAGVTTAVTPFKPAIAATELARQVPLFVNRSLGEVEVDAANSEIQAAAAGFLENSREEIAANDGFICPTVRDIHQIDRESILKGMERLFPPERFNAADLRARDLLLARATLLAEAFGKVFPKDHYRMPCAPAKDSTMISLFAGTVEGMDLTEEAHCHPMYLMWWNLSGPGIEVDLGLGENLSPLPEGGICLVEGGRDHRAPVVTDHPRDQLRAMLVLRGDPNDESLANAQKYFGELPTYTAWAQVFDN